MNTTPQSPLVIAMDEVESSQIHAIGYDDKTGTLAIQFKGKNGPGSVYHYQNIGADFFAEFKAAESIGKFFGKNIKPFPDAFPFTKIEPTA